MGDTKPLEEYFADWESFVFGFGYGTGKAPILIALQQFMGLCNLSANGRYEYDRIEPVLGPTVTWLLINTLCRVDIIEYGTSPRYGWLTLHGQKLRAFVLSHTLDELVTTLDGEHDFDEPSDTDENPFYHTYKRVGNAK